MSDLDRCSWKLVAKDKFVLGMPADRCGEQATIRVIRPQRKTDLFLCEVHLNEFIDTWGLHYNVEVICPEPQKPCDCGREIHYVCPLHSGRTR